jgi:HSP20 family protein
MSKKTKDDTSVATTETTPTAGTGTPTWSDWFDHWPEMFARRWPETFRNLPFGSMPFGTDMFRMEQLTEDDGTMVVRAEMPGMDPAEDVEISIDGRLMTISAEREERHQADETNGYLTEFQYGSFSRSVQLPVGARTDDVVATYRDGILEVRVPVDADSPAVRQVPITE